MPDVVNLVSTVEAVAILGCDRSSISRWVSSGRLVPAHKLPGQTGAFLFDRAAIEALRDELKAEALARFDEAAS